MSAPLRLCIALEGESKSISEAAQYWHASGTKPRYCAAERKGYTTHAVETYNLPAAKLTSLVSDTTRNSGGINMAVFYYQPPYTLF